ncbi:MAG: toprim domain-containing protein [Nanoarchaeota archaeon]|nr:toprim domain-containing protein [Nanoarchaeota archaeon]
MVRILIDIKMKFNLNLKQDIEKYKDYVVVVEGKKDVASLKALGFDRVYAIHSTGVAIREKIEQIAHEVGKRDKVCILTDFDKKGKQLYMLLKKEFQEMGVRLDSSLRGVLLKAGVSHIEGLYQFMKKVYNIN